LDIEPDKEFHLNREMHTASTLDWRYLSKITFLKMMLSPCLTFPMMNSMSE
jgi:hypothetical protein